MEVDNFAVVIPLSQEIALLAPHELFRIAPGFLEPRLPRGGHILANHACHVCCVRKIEHAGRRQGAETG
jgi:hypothetical protein